MAGNKGRNKVRLHMFKPIEDRHSINQTTHPQRLKQMTLLSPDSLHFKASMMVPRIAWVASGAGKIPSWRANRIPASKHSF